MHVTAKLRELRLRAKMSMHDAAKAVGLSGQSSYQRYEDPNLFKGEFLPLDLIRKLAPAFRDRGVPMHETLALAGVPSVLDMAGDPDSVKIPLDMMRIVIEALASYRAEEGLTIPPSEESEMATSFCRWVAREAAAGRMVEPLTVERAKSHFRLLDIRRLN